MLGTYFLTKEGEKVNAIVLFKLYISSISTDSIIHFVSLIVAVQPQEKYSGCGSERKTEKPELEPPAELNIFAKEESLHAAESHG